MESKFYLTKLMKEYMIKFDRAYDNQTSPRYSSWEARARSYIRAYIVAEMRMNFNHTVEEAFVKGYNLGRNFREEFEKEL